MELKLLLRTCTHTDTTESCPEYECCTYILLIEKLTVNSVASPLNLSYYIRGNIHSKWSFLGELKDFKLPSEKNGKNA